MITRTIQFVTALLTAEVAHGQGTFRNLDFEEANLPIIPRGEFGGIVSVADGIPSWRAYQGLDGGETFRIAHNGFSLGGPAIFIHGPQSDASKILAGNYSVELFAGAGRVAIGQTGQIPSDAKSLRFFASPGTVLQVSFSGNPLPYFQLTSSGAYNILGADVAGYAGQSGELLFSSQLVPPNTFSGGIIDNIQFSSQVVPEPSALTLLFGGLLFLGVTHRYARRCNGGLGIL